jgi:hypothetical protein
MAEFGDFSRALLWHGSPVFTPRQYLTRTRRQCNRSLPQPDIYVETYVTGYNTVPGQTDNTPCIAASGANICGRRDTVACPPFLPLGAVVEIKGKKYVCEDRIARKYRARLDVNCHKDKRCPFEMTGWTMVKLVLH